MKMKPSNALIALYSDQDVTEDMLPFIQVALEQERNNILRDVEDGLSAQNALLRKLGLLGQEVLIEAHAALNPDETSAEFSEFIKEATALFKL